MRNHNRLLAIVAIVIFPAAISLAAEVDRKEPAPKELRGVGVTPHQNAQLPLDLPFVESDGQKVALGKFFDGKRPVILTMNYSNCPMLCSLQLNGLIDALRAMPWDIGKQYQIVTVSIDPTELPQRAALTKQKYLKLYGRPGSAEGWHFLTGREEDIKKLAAVVGFGYAWIPEQHAYAHPALLILCTPDGRVARYLGGVRYEPLTLRLALTEVSEGKAGSAFDQVLLYCFHYDETAGHYGPAAFHFMQIIAAIGAIFMGVVLVAYRRRELRKTRAKGNRAGAIGAS
jgi:protein SCO1/2